MKYFIFMMVLIFPIFSKAEISYNTMPEDSYSNPNIIYFPLEKPVESIFYKRSYVGKNDIVIFVDGHWYVAENLYHYDGLCMHFHKNER